MAALIDFTGCDVDDLREAARRSEVLLRWHTLIGDRFGEAGHCEPDADLLSVLGALETDRLAAGLHLARDLTGLIAFGLQCLPAFDPGELDFEHTLKLLGEIPGHLAHDGVLRGYVHRASKTACASTDELTGNLTVPVERDYAFGLFPGMAEEAPEDRDQLVPTEDDLVIVRLLLTWHPSTLSAVRRAADSLRRLNATVAAGEATSAQPEIPAIREAAPDQDSDNPDTTPLASLSLRRAIIAAGGPAALSRELGISSPAISQWLQVPVARVLDVERVTGVPRHELRPDIYPGVDVGCGALRVTIGGAKS